MQKQSSYSWWVTGASLIGPTFGHFAPFPPPGPILASPHRSPHHPPPHPAAFYPHPLVYWPYPSPPVSPTTYFNQPTHTPTHVPGNHGPPMYSLDYIPAVQTTNYANQASPLSPTVGIPTNTSGLILSPNKTPTMTLVPNPKQYPAVAAGPPTAVAPLTPTYHSKMTLQPSHPLRHSHTNLYHHYNSPAPLQTAAVLAVPTPPAVAAVVHTPPAVAAVVHTPPGRNLKTPPTEQPLLAIDASHSVNHSALKTNTNNSSNTPSMPPANNKTIVVAKDKNSPSSSATNMNGVVPVVTNHCVELYTS